MDDRYDFNLLLGYVEDELIATDRARVEAMLAEDADLAALVADLRRDRDRLRSAPPAEPGEDLAEGAIAALERQLLFDDASVGVASPAAVPHRFRLAQLLTYGGIAAVLALTVTVVFWSLQSDPEPTGAIAMSDTARESMSLAEATIEAQRKAALGRQAEAAETPAEEKVQVAETLDEMATEQATRLAAGGGGANVSVGDDGTLLADADVANDALGQANPGEALALMDAPHSRALDSAEVAPRDDFRREVPAEAMAKGPDAPAADVALDQVPEALAMEPAMPAVSAPTSPPVNAARMASKREADHSIASSETLALNFDTPASLPEPFEYRAPDHAPRFALPATTAQRYTVNVVTASPEASRQQLSAWALRNNIALAEVPETSPASSEGFAAAAEFADVQGPAGPAQSQSAAIAESESAPPARDDHEGVDEPAVEPRQRIAAHRLQLNVAADQVDDLVAALSSPTSAGRPQVVSLVPWMNWQAPLQRAEVEVVIDSPAVLNAGPATTKSSN